MKRRVLLITVLVCILLFSFAAIAGAKYAGFAYNNPVIPQGGGAPQTNPYPGYLSWTGANAIYNREVGGDQGPTPTAHGNYVSTTTKCPVCHASHRAFSDAASTPTNPGVDRGLTVDGSFNRVFSARRLATNDYRALENPVLDSTSSCVNCHTAWGAGSSSKKIEWENLLTTESSDPGGPHHHADPGCTGSCHTGGAHGRSTSDFNGMNAFMLGSDKDDAITAAMKSGNVSQRITYVEGTHAGQGGTGATWFQSGSTGAKSDGSTPDNVNNTQYAAAKAMATGYTCAQAGCHTSSQFAVNNWGFSENHVADPRESNPDTNPNPQTAAFTGHLTGAFNHNASRPDCAPCHPGGLAGGYRTDASITGDNRLATQYGCDQCHDLVGRLTNTTAFPHGNRAIDVYEWDASGTRVTVDAANLPSGNLWMYKSDISALTDVANQPATDASFRIVKNATSWSSTTGTGNINDGVCLKCHISIDSQSFTARGAAGGQNINPAGRIHTARFVNGALTNTTTASAHIFLWK